MTVYQSMGRGSWIVQRTLLGLPIRKATGCYDRAEAEGVEETLLTLARHGRRQLLEAFDRDQITGPELVAAVEQFGLSYEVTVERAKRLQPAIEAWLEDADLADGTKRDYRNGLAHLHRGRRRASVAELPQLLARYARRSGARARMFGLVKAAAQSFVSATVPQGRHSALWRDVAAVKGPARTARNVVKAFSPDRARAIAEQLGRLGPMWWTLCTTGMGRKEYWRTKWEVLEDRILVHGTKREHRDRVVPRLCTPVRPLVREKAFAEALAAAAGELKLKRLTIYAARRTYAHFLELAKIDDSRCDAYMGHSPKGVRGLYREHDVEPYLAGDARTLRDAIGPDPQFVRAVA